MVGSIRLQNFWNKQVVILNEENYIQKRSSTHRPLNVNQRHSDNYSESLRHSWRGCNSQRRSCSRRHNSTNSQHAVREANITSVNNCLKHSSYAARKQPEHSQSYNTLSK